MIIAGQVGKNKISVGEKTSTVWRIIFTLIFRFLPSPGGAISRNIKRRLLSENITVFCIEKVVDGVADGEYVRIKYSY